MTVRCIVALLFLLVARPALAAVGPTSGTAPTPLEEVFPEEQPVTAVVADPTINDRIDSLVGWLGAGLSMHKENYLLFPTWSDRADASDDMEVKLQLSLKQQIFDSRFYVAYTQKSFWRILDQADSRPFRETNHNPEIFFRYVAPPEMAGRFSAWGADIGAEHESNGAREPISRSWNRLYVTPFVTWGTCVPTSKSGIDSPKRSRTTPWIPPATKTPTSRTISATANCA